MLDLGVLGGLALNTKVTSVALSQTSPNESTIGDNPFTGIVKGTISWKFKKAFHFFVEGGYRLLRTKEIQGLSDSGNGSTVFGNPFNPVTVDLSGLFTGVGIALSF